LALRDKLADAIYAHPEDYTKALSFFKIDVDTLSKKAFYHQIRNHLTEFKNTVGDLTKRMALARKIVENRSAYVVVKEDPSVNWHSCNVMPITLLKSNSLLHYLRKKGRTTKRY
jgi:hypothetical protein